MGVSGVVQGDMVKQTMSRNLQVAIPVLNIFLA